MSESASPKNALIYGVDDTPPWGQTLGLGLQHYLTMFGSTVAIPLILAKPLGIADAPQSIALLIGTIFVASGLATLLQTSRLGNRLPIVQGGTFSFLSPAIAICSLPSLAQQPWQLRMRHVQGAVISGSAVEILLGYSGLVGRLVRLIGPISIAPTIALIGLSLFKVGAPVAGKHWGIGALTISLIIVCSQLLRRVHRAFELFPIVLSIGGAWLVAALLSALGVFGADHPAYTSLSNLKATPWVRLPYPLQWGMPVFSVAATTAMLAGYLASMVESIGDYYACARLSGAPLPTRRTINRGIGTEGIGCLIAGLLGTGNGTTSYSENIGAIGLTRVGSRRVVQVGALLMIALGTVGKFGAVFTTIPQPIVGGMYCAMFGIIAAVGLSNLQYVDLNSPRNLFILGFAFFMGLSLPQYFATNPLRFEPQWAADLLNTLGSTGMAVGALISMVLDNVIPGSASERGHDAWHAAER
ncbi:MAG: purine/pyrimidine permease [Deltaproteobacteria bacterium]|nr:purine/pyrimidine permease [Deltaproteobacteria bacterium]